MADLLYALFALKVAIDEIVTDDEIHVVRLQTLKRDVIGEDQITFDVVILLLDVPRDGNIDMNSASFRTGLLIFEKVFVGLSANAVNFRNILVQGLITDILGVLYQVIIFTDNPTDANLSHFAAFLLFLLWQ